MDNMLTIIKKMSMNQYFHFTPVIPCCEIQNWRKCLNVASANGANILNNPGLIKIVISICTT